MQFEAVAEAEKVTERGAAPEAGTAVAVQVKLQGAATAMVPDFVQVTPSTVAVIDQLYVPAAVYVCDGFCWEEV